MKRITLALAAVLIFMGCNVEHKEESKTYSIDYKIDRTCIGSCKVEDNEKCSTHHTFNSKEAFCSGLLDEALNKNCARRERRQEYKNSCDTSFTPIVETLTVLPPSDVETLTSLGFKFVFVATKNGKDTVLVNEEANNLEFSVADTTCRTRIQAKKDPVYAGETLGVLALECESHGAKSVSSASCSTRFPEAQNHFEIKDDQDAFVLDLICRIKVP